MGFGDNMRYKEISYDSIKFHAMLLVLYDYCQKLDLLKNHKPINNHCLVRNMQLPNCSH